MPGLTLKALPLLLANVEVRGQQALLLITLVDEVVNSCDLVVLIIIYAFFRIVRLESKLLNHLEYLGLGWDRILADNEAFILAYRRVLLEPPVLPDIARRETSIWVCVQNLGKDIAPVLGNKLRQYKVALENLFVKLCCIGVFKGQVPAYHRVKNDSTAPHVHL